MKLSNINLVLINFAIYLVLGLIVSISAFYIIPSLGGNQSQVISYENYLKISSLPFIIVLFLSSFIHGKVYVDYKIKSHLIAFSLLLIILVLILESALDLLPFLIITFYKDFFEIIWVLLAIAIIFDFKVLMV
ncbi:MAG: hypothetical protein QXX36_03015 [Candidatus Rehaiarchaeum fermentans]|nr:hypothetical protein [Candidatus Rehaiarchaeum fermentans]MCW1302571.1 hypothetical protein [Candidatus Rehaiarchaeum fermentans]